jgi:hypothetical protein
VSSRWHVRRDAIGGSADRCIRRMTIECVGLLTLIAETVSCLHVSLTGIADGDIRPVCGRESLLSGRVRG